MGPWLSVCHLCQCHLFYKSYHLSRVYITHLSVTYAQPIMVLEGLQVSTCPWVCGGKYDAKEVEWLHAVIDDELPMRA